MAASDIQIRTLIIFLYKMLQISEGQISKIIVFISDFIGEGGFV